MRVVLVAIALMAIPLFAEGPGREPPGGKAKDAWEWTVEERLAARFDPVRAERRATRLQAEGVASAPEALGALTGDAEPQLFLPGELFGSLLGGLHADADFAATSRAILRDRILEFGFDDVTFWQELEGAISSHQRMAARHAALVKQFRDADEMERNTIREQTAVMGPDLCRSRIVALHAAREQFGGKDFDRFLYTVVAPVLSVSASDDPSLLSAEHLRYLEGGCQ
jgi:hypothetical protein